MSVPLVIPYLLAGFLLYSALTVRPSDSWDDGARAAVVLSCVLTLVAGGTAAGLVALPSARRATGWWWAAPAPVPAVVAVIRWVTTE